MSAFGGKADVEHGPVGTTLETVLLDEHVGGALEMCWYLFSWGKDVKVLEPKHLADMLADHLLNGC
jgi:predicted DNA-binding transcriptional regulator YafY